MYTSPENYLKDLLSCIQDVYKHLSSERDSTHQFLSDINSGLFRKHKENIVVPLDLQAHRITLEDHDLFVLDGYLLLAQKLLENPENRFNYFSLRVLYEIGFNKIDILFADDIPDPEKQSFIRMDCLSDLLGMTEQKYKDYFLRLLRDEREKLDPASRKLFEEAEQLLKADSNIQVPLLKKIRRLTNSRLKNYTQKVQTPSLIKGKSDFSSINVILSHLLHGNPISIRVALHPDFAESNKNHVLVMLWSTGLNILIRLQPYIKDQEILSKSKSVFKDAESAWKGFLERQAVYRKVYNR